MSLFPDDHSDKRRAMVNCAKHSSQCFAGVVPKHLLPQQKLVTLQKEMTEALL